MTARRTEPYGKTLLQGRPYRNAANTDIRETFRLHTAPKKPERVVPIKRSSR